MTPETIAETRSEIKSLRMAAEECGRARGEELRRMADELATRLRALGHNNTSRWS